MHIYIQSKALQKRADIECARNAKHIFWQEYQCDITVK